MVFGSFLFHTDQVHPQTIEPVCKLPPLPAKFNLYLVKRQKNKNVLSINIKRHTGTQYDWSGGSCAIYMKLCHINYEMR